MSFSIYESQCYFCKHLTRIDGKPTFKCAAFARIPPELLGAPTGKPMTVADHRKPYPGDGGIQFEPLPGEKHPLEVTDERSADEQG